MPTNEEASLWPCENLLLKEGRKHYRSSVSPIHWQLRSLLSAERQGVLYFPAGVNNTHIQRLDTSTRECETIKVISFHPRCLIASKGWICCGGESGELVVIRESGSNDGQADNLSRDFRSRLNSMELSNLVEVPINQLQRDMLTVVERINGSSKSWSASSHKVGTERVNCITIWHPPKGTGASARGQYDSPVAVVANNDKTITVIGLYEPDVSKDVLEYPDCVNRGVISPDGTLLVAICDDPYLYIHTRRSFTQHYHGVSRDSFKWSPVPKIRLKGQWSRDTTDCRGSFAACFSPSGKYLAVGTQYGTISIFDAVSLKDPDSDPLITYFDSDRAPSECGAVRDMAFSPGPYDLLAWSEHRGRIGVADARTNFMRRQIISLHDHDGFDHLSLNDGSTIDPRLLDPRNERDTETDRNVEGDRHNERPFSLLERWGRAMSDRPLPNPESTSRINQPFSPDEVAVLDALQSNRRQREIRDRGEQPDQRLAEHRSQRAAERAGGAVWRTPGWAERVSLPADPNPTTRGNTRYPLGLGRRRLSPDMTLQELFDMQQRIQAYREANMPNQHATMSRIIERERMRESRDQHRSGISQPSLEQDRERLPGTGREPRRRSASIMYTLAQNVDNISQMMANRSQGQAQAQAQAQAGESNDGPATTSTSSRERASSPWISGRFDSGWADVQNLAMMYGSDSGPREEPRTESSRVRRGIPVIADVWTNDSLFSRIRAGSREHQQNPDDTAGLTWSEDGQILYVAAEDGIYELHVNMHGRRVFPDITLR